ncbi:MAG TPA: biotin synthase [Caldimonas sp.]|jgi:malonyl-CoA O-methyltransferase|nr:biotin synthase [Caldimonas sp.]
MASSEPSKARGVDPVAARAALARLARNDTRPWLHDEIARRLVERLAPMRAEPRRIVEWWAGAGGGDDVVRAAYPRAERVAVEADAAWAARRRAAERRPWWSLGGGAGALVLDESAGDAEIGRAQLVWANMALHLVVDPPALIARWHALLEVEGIAVFSCLGPGTLRELRDLYRGEGWPTPTPGYIDMHDLGDMLVDAGFADPVLDQETITLRWQSAEALLAELRQLGGNTAPDRHRGLRTPAWRRRLVAALRERADADGSIGLSIEVAYGHGFKPAPRLRADAPVAVSLDEMRAMVRRPRPSS